MRLDGIIAFVTVVDCGSINEAARQLRLSKSTVSERLSELEHALGARLLNRNSRQFALTEDGMALLDRARRIVAETAEARKIWRGGAARCRARSASPCPAPSATCISGRSCMIS
ncbi:LysR family transcriptional regulator [Tistrella bauzanensis]